MTSLENAGQTNKANEKGVPNIKAQIILNGIEVPVDVFVVSRDYAATQTQTLTPTEGPIKRFLRWVFQVW